LRGLAAAFADRAVHCGGLIAQLPPPTDVIRDMLATPPGTRKINLPVVTRIVYAPTMAPDGSIQTTPGYQPATSTFYVEPGFTVRSDRRSRAPLRRTFPFSGVPPPPAAHHTSPSRGVTKPIHGQLLVTMSVGPSSIAGRPAWSCGTLTLNTARVILPAESATRSVTE
jgi:hypothetical protein